MKIAVMNGPNLNFLGIRDPHIYGNQTLDGLQNQLTTYANTKEVSLMFFQSNHEGEMIDFMQKCYYEKVDGIILNPGALTHYSYALTDAIKSISIPTVEVHISNIHARESFRQHSVTAANCIGIIGGFGLQSYVLGFDAIYHYIKTQEEEAKQNEN